MKTKLHSFNQPNSITSLTLRAHKAESISIENASTVMTMIQWAVIAALLVIMNQQASAQQKASGTLAVAPIELTGIVTSAENGTALTGVNVFIKETSIGTSTDEKGRFSLKHSFKEGDVIVFTFIGLETQYYTIPASNETALNIDVKMSQTALMTFGELSEDGLYSERRAKTNFWSKVKGAFK